VTQSFPDISDILARKQEGRKELAARSFVDKIKAMEALRERLAPFKAAREKRQAEMLSKRSDHSRGTPSLG
jgi:hypothetical protein